MSNGDALLEVLRQAGVRVPQTGNVSCPFHTDADPSLSIERTTGKWHCFSCGKGGGPAQLAQYLQEKGEQVTVPTIPTADSLSYQRPERPKPSVKPVPVSRVEALETILRHAEKRYEESPQAQEYVASRGLTEASRAMFRLGVGGPDAGALEGMLLIPYLGPNGRPVQIRGRCFECGTGSCVGHPKYRGMAGDTTKLFNSRVIKLNPSSPELHLAEGECLPDGAEVFTQRGWVDLADLTTEDRVAQWDDGQVSLVKPLCYIEKDFDGELIEFSNKRGLRMTMTPGHRMPYFGLSRRSPDGRNRQFREARDIVGKTQGIFPRVGMHDGPGTKLTEDEWTLMLAISADLVVRQPKNSGYGGRADALPYVVGVFTKVRKADRLARVLERLGIPYGATRVNGGTKMQYTFSLPERYHGFGRMLDHGLLARMSQNEREFVLAELIEWDGNLVPNRNQTEYSSKYEANAIWVQTVAHLAGRMSTLMRRSNQWGEWIKVSILHDKKHSSWQTMRASYVPYTGKVRCVTVPSGAIMVRQHGHIVVSGNCDTMALTQCGLMAVGIPGVNNLKKHHLTLISGFDTVYVWADNDAPGEGLANAVLEAVPWAHRVFIPDGDVNTTLMRRGEAGVLERIGR